MCVCSCVFCTVTNSVVKLKQLFFSRGCLFLLLIEALSWREESHLTVQNVWWSQLCHKSLPPAPSSDFNTPTALSNNLLGIILNRLHHISTFKPLRKPTKQLHSQEWIIIPVWEGERKLSDWISVYSRCVLHFQDIPRASRCCSYICDSDGIINCGKVGESSRLFRALKQHWYFKHYFKTCVFVWMLFWSQSIIFLTNDYCCEKERCQFVIHTNPQLISMMQKRVLSQITGVICGV